MTMQRDEGWLPAIKGIFTWRVWRPGRSSILARMRALWLVWLAWTPALASVLLWRGENEGVLARWLVGVGWGLFGLCALFVWANGKRLLNAAMVLPEVALPRTLLVLWARTLAFAMGPFALAMGVSQATLDSEQVDYPLYWAVLVTMTMLIVIAPTVRRLIRIEDARMQSDGVSVVGALSTRTVKFADRRRKAPRT